MDLGPFTITPAQVEALDESFVPFMNALLAADCAAHGVRDRLSITDRENDPDEGLDAEVRHAPGSTFVPPAISGWQFKRSSPAPRELAKELAKPGVEQILREGGVYCLAVAKGLTPVKKRKLVAKFAELVGNDQLIRVLNAKDLADWASAYPAVLALPALGVNTGGLIDYETWASRHTTEWVADTARDATIRDLQVRLRDPSVAVTRIEEPGGMGATRLVLEALRDPALAAWTVYAEQPDDFNASVANYLERGGRKAIIVVNRCDRGTHQRLARRFVPGGGRLLITAGAGEDPRPPVDGAGVFRVEPMAETDLGRVIEASFPGLPWPQQRFAAEHADGSVELAILFAQRLLALKQAEAADLIASADPETVLRLAVPDGMALVAAMALALLRRVHWTTTDDGDAAALARFVPLDLAEFRAQASVLTARRLVKREGRYLSLRPHPLAVVLATRVWEDRAEEIADNLLPVLSLDGLEALLARAASLGRHPRAQAALRGLLRPWGLLGSWAAIQAPGVAHLLGYLAVIDPAQTVAMLARELFGRPAGELAAAHSRPQLVWAAEKIAWHQATFIGAAEVLLRLAATARERDTHAADAWVALFGARVPATSASPGMRLAYLDDCAASSDPATRRLVVDAAAYGVILLEWRVASAEHQFGHAAPITGGVASVDDDRHYRDHMLKLLAHLATDADQSVAGAAVDAVLKAVPQWLGMYLEPEVLATVASLPRDADARVRAATHRWLAIRRDELSAETRAVIERLAKTREPTDVVDKIKDFAGVQPHHRDKDAAKRFDALLAEAVQQGRAEEIITWLGDVNAPGAWLVGHTLAAAEVDTAEVDVGGRLALLGQADLRAADGYLDRLTQMRGQDWQEQILDTLVGRGEAFLAVWLTVSGNATAAGLARVRHLIGAGAMRPAAVGAWQPAAWVQQLSPTDVASLIKEWHGVSSTAEDEVVLLELADGYLHEHPDTLDALEMVVWPLLEALPRLPATRGVLFDWIRPARRLLDRDPARVARILIQGIAAGVIVVEGLAANSADPTVLGVDPIAGLLKLAAARAPEALWAELTAALEGSQRGKVMWATRGWLLDHLPLDMITGWVAAGGIERARVAAKLVRAGREQPTPLARWLLQHHGSDDQVAVALADQFEFGIWTGPEAVRLREWLERLGKWRAEGGMVARWADMVATALEERLQLVERAEAEGSS